MTAEPCDATRPVWATPTASLATTRLGDTWRDVNPPSAPPGRAWRRPRPAVLCPPSWGEWGGEWGWVGEQAGGLTAMGAGGLEQSERLERPWQAARGYEGSCARHWGGRSAGMGIGQAVESGQHHSSPAAGSPAGPCAAPAVAREEPQGLGRKRPWRTCLGPSSSPPTAQPSPGRHGQQPAPPPPSCQGDKLDARIAHVCWCSTNLSPLGSDNNFIACGSARWQGCRAP